MKGEVTWALIMCYATLERTCDLDTKVSDLRLDSMTL